MRPKMTRLRTHQHRVDPKRLIFMDGGLANSTRPIDLANMSRTAGLPLPVH